MKGVYQQCAEKHLHRYLAEFDFRSSNRIALGIDDTARAKNKSLSAKTASNPSDSKKPLGSMGLMRKAMRSRK